MLDYILLINLRNCFLFYRYIMYYQIFIQNSIILSNIFIQYSSVKGRMTYCTGSN